MLKQSSFDVPSPDQVCGDSALQAQRRYLACLIEGAETGTWEWNVVTGHLVVNSRSAEMLGYGVADLEPMTRDSWSCLIHPSDAALSAAELQRHIAGATRTYQQDIRMRHRDGHWVWVATHGTVLTRTAEGKPEWMFGTHHDVTTQKTQQHALQRSEEFLRRAGELAGVCGWEFDVVADQLYWSDAAYRLHGVDPAVPLVTDDAMRYYLPNSQKILREAVQCALDGGPGWDLELELLRVDGSWFWGRCVGSLIRNAEGKPLRFLGASQDISAQRKAHQQVRLAGERLSLATQGAGIGIWEYDVARETVHLDAISSRLAGLPDAPNILSSAAWQGLVERRDLPELRRSVRAAQKGEETTDIAFRVRLPNGDVRHLRAAARILRDVDGSPQRLIGCAWDETGVHRTATELIHQQRLMQVTLLSIADAVVTTDSSGRVAWLNPEAERLTGWTRARAMGQYIDTVFNIVDEKTRSPADNEVMSCMLRRVETRPTGRIILQSASGEIYGVEASVAPILDGKKLLGAVLVFRDVTANRRQHDEIQFRATHDMLTGLLNREEFGTRLQRLLREDAPRTTPHALLYCDLDQFKVVNDACGHAVGDIVLQEVGRLLTDEVRVSDPVARLGGDEFSVILENCPLDAARRIANNICQRLDVYRFQHAGRGIRVGASIGLVPLDRDWSSQAAVMQAADTACYAAKEAGRNRVHEWLDTDTAVQSRNADMQWATRLEQALDEDRFVLFAQRIIALKPGAEGVFAEVLTRMVDTDGSLVAPGLFLPAAERYQLASRIDRWVLGKVLDWLTQCTQLERVSLLCVNLSGQSIGDREFHRHAISLLRDAGDSVCRRVCLKVTETAAITNFEDATTFISAVRALNVRIALDDFGAGASSFGYLKTLRVDKLKIDGQFIKNLVGDKLNDVTVRCFVEVAGVLGIETVAEFVDSPEALARLREIGVDYAQGYLLHKPEPIEKVIGLAALSTFAEVLVVEGA